MATKELPSRPQSAKPSVCLNEIDNLAGYVQTKAHQIEHLMAATEDALDDSCDFSEEGRAKRADATDRISLFLNLAGDIAREIKKLGEQIEVQGFQAKKGFAA